MRTKRFFVVQGLSKFLVETFDSLVGVTGARLTATNVNDQETVISGGAVVSGNSVYINIPASYNVAENFPASFLLETTLNGTDYTGVATYNGVIRNVVGASQKPEFVAGERIATGWNQTGTATTFANSPSNTIIPGLAIVVPPTEEDVWLEWGLTIGITTAGAGYVLAKCFEITGGIATYLEGSLSRIESSRVATTAAEVQRGRVQVGPSAVTRQFALYGTTIQDGGSSLVAYARNFSGSTSGSWISAVAG